MAEEEGIYGGTPDGLSVDDKAAFVNLLRKKPALGCFLALDMFIGLVLGLWGLGMLHFWGFFWGVVLMGVVVPGIDFGLFLKDDKFRRSETCCLEACNCTAACGLAGVVQGIVVFVGVLLLLVKVEMASEPVGGPGALEATVGAFPPACTGNGWDMGCTRLVPVRSGPHRVNCRTACTNVTECVTADASRSWCTTDERLQVTRFASESVAEASTIAPFVDAALEGMSGGVSVDVQDATDACDVFRHMTVQSSFFGFRDDVWVCVQKGTCDSLSVWEVWAQGQLRIGKGDIGQNYKHVQEIQDGVKAAADAASTPWLAKTESQC